jgi:hypothetical protein
VVMVLLTIGLKNRQQELSTVKNNQQSAQSG